MANRHSSRMQALGIKKMLPADCDKSVTLEMLSDKQREVLDLLLDRRSNKEIAALLEISPSAVEQRLQSVRRRLGITRRADLARTYLTLLETSQNQTGQELQVANNGHYLQTGTITGDGDLRHITPVSYDAIASRANSPIESKEGCVCHRGSNSPPITFVDRIDRIAGLQGRIAAIAVTAASFTTLLATVARLD